MSGSGREVEVFRGWPLELDSVICILTAGSVKCDLGGFRVP